MKRIRQILFWAHFGIGMLVGLLVMWLAATGTLLSFKPQVLRFLDQRAVLKHAPVTAQALSAEELLAKFVEKFPELSPSNFERKKAVSSPVVIRAEKKPYFLHPVTGDFLGELNQDWRDFFDTVDDLHRWFALKDGAQDVGNMIIGSSTLAFSVLLMTGLVLWIPKKLNKKAFKAVTVPKIKGKGRALWWNWHLVTGLWLAPMILVISVTGTTLAFPWAKKAYLAAFGQKVPERKNNDEHEKKSEPLYTKGLNQSIALAQESVLPQWTSMNVTLDLTKKSAYSIILSDGGMGQAYCATRIEVDPKSQTILKSENEWNAMPVARRFTNFARWSHTGEFFGLFGQIAAASAALGAILLSLTGYAMGIQRLKNMRLRKKPMKS